jgi:hypothetical protein
VSTWKKVAIGAVVVAVLLVAWKLTSPPAKSSTAEPKEPTTGTGIAGKFKPVATAGVAKVRGLVTNWRAPSFIAV